MAVPGSVGRYSTVICVRYRWFCCVACVLPGLAAAAGGHVAFRAQGGLPGASVEAVGALLLMLLPWCQGAVSCFCFGCTWGCLMLCVLLCSRRLSAHSVFLAVAGCLGPCLCAPVLASLVRARGLAFRLGACLLGFPAVVCAVTPFPTISSFCNRHGGCRTCGGYLGFGKGAGGALTECSW